MKNLKKSIIIALAVSSISIVSCSKEDTPQPIQTTASSTPSKICNCGIVVSKNPALVNVTLQNTCSNNTDIFVVSFSEMDSANNGDTICIPSVNNW